jgi:hypothetical protein
MYRQVRGVVYRTDGITPWAFCRVKFQRVKGSYTALIQYPPDAIEVSSNNLGEITVDLWCNQEGESPTWYTCYLPNNDYFKFVVPSGTTTLELSFLRESSITPPQPGYNTIKEYVDSEIENIVVGNTSKVYSPNFIASTNISALKVIAVNNGQAYLPSSSIVGDAFRIVGVSEVSANTGSNIKAVIAGVISDSGWSWQGDRPIFLGSNGTLTQSVPSGFLKQIAEPLSSQSILINLQGVIIL